MWSRNTSFVQGAFILAKDITKLKKNFIPDDCHLIIAISHDCDIACSDLDIEPNIEFIAAKILPISKGDGNYTCAKNPRKLRLLHERGQVLELCANKKFIIPKIELESITSNLYTLDDKNKKILQTWLSVRYKRHAFPESLAVRLDFVENFLKTEGKKHFQEILSYWLDYKPRNIELETGEPYELSIKIVYASEIPDAENIATELAIKLKNKFESYMQNAYDAQKIDLRLCGAFSDTEFTLYDQRNYLEYALEYISHQKVT